MNERSYMGLAVVFVGLICCICIVGMVVLSLQGKDVTNLGIIAGNCTGALAVLIVPKGGNGKPAA